VLPNDSLAVSWLRPLIHLSIHKKINLKFFAVLCV